MSLQIYTLTTGDDVYVPAQSTHVTGNFHETFDRLVP